jgi:hypothetical protein
MGWDGMDGTSISTTQEMHTPRRDAVKEESGFESSGNGGQNYICSRKRPRT